MSGARPSGGAGGAASTVARLEEAAEAAYSAMYDARSPSDAAAHYSDAKEALYDAIAAARAAGQTEMAERLEKRLQHIKDVFRSQFS